MKIIALKQRRHRLTAVYFEKCGDAETIDSETLLMSGYHEGSDISEDDWQELKGEAQRNRAYEKALYLLEYRAHTKKELFTKLRAVFPADVCEHALSRIEQLGLCDDEAFAKDFAEELFKRKGFGKRRVAFELSKKGVDRDIIDSVLCQYEDEDPVESIVRVIEKKYCPLPEDEKKYQRIYAGLARMGYGYGDIKTALLRVKNGE